MAIHLIATLDTKGVEIGFIRDFLAALDLPTVLVDCGCQGEPLIAADISRDEIFRAAGTSLSDVRAKGDRGHAVSAAAAGAAAVIRKQFDAGQVSGVIGIGGSAGTTIAATAMRTMPIGIPKVLVSTIASGNTRSFVADKDILVLNSIVDIAGLNRISRIVLSEAAAAVAGMVRLGNGGGKVGGWEGGKMRSAEGSKSSPPPTVPSSHPPTTTADRPLIAATMFGVTTPCVNRAREILEAAGYEVLVFHATGSGGQAMESLIREGLIAGVLDITTTELADEFVGGVFSAGPTRLTAAAEKGVPQVVSVGATDMVNFGPPDTVPDKFRDRLFYHHNANVTLMRTTVDENRQIGEDLGRKLSTSKGPTAILLPLGGVSAIDAPGKPFDNPAARSALFEAIHATHGATELVESENHINDPAFAEAAAKKLLMLIG